MTAATRKRENAPLFRLDQIDVAAANPVVVVASNVVHGAHRPVLVGCFDEQIHGLLVVPLATAASCLVAPGQVAHGWADCKWRSVVGNDLSSA
jgi:hypothetical protein